MSLPFTDSIKLLDGITADVAAVTALGTNTADVSKRQKMSLQFVRTGIGTGTGLFTVYVSNDGTNWVQYNRLITNATVADNHNDVKVASITLTGGGTTDSFVFFPSGDHFKYIGVACDVTTDGTYTAILQSGG